MGNIISCSCSEDIDSSDELTSILLPIPSSLTPQCQSMQSMSLRYRAPSPLPLPSTPPSTPTSPPTSPTPPSPKQFNTKFPVLWESLIEQISDVWNINQCDPQIFELNEEIPNSIHIKSIHNKNYNEWKSVFGTQIIRFGQYKVWKLKIYPRFIAINNNDFGIADIVVGIVDVDTVKNNDDIIKYNHFNGGFWLFPFFGYGYYGFNGKKFHQQRRGKNYGRKYQIGDIITIELDMITNELNFYVNDIPNGISYNIDQDRAYILALSLCNDNYDIQLCQH